MLNYGFLPPTDEELKSSQDAGYVLGAMGGMKGKQINPSGQWIEYLPEFEPQRRKFDTNSCTQFATITAIQILEKFLYGETQNYSERALAILSGNSRNGNSPHRVADVVRKRGLIREELLPFTDELNSWEEYMKPDPLPREIRRDGKDWLRKYKFNHEEVRETLEGLKVSPLGVSVLAWAKNDKGLYYNPGNKDNHWVCLIIGYRLGEYWEIFDSYLDDGEPIKKLEWDFPFGYVKSYYLEKREYKECFLRKIINNFLFATFSK